MDERTAELVGICLAVESPTSYYVPVGHLSSSGFQPEQIGLFSGEVKLAEDQLALDSVLAALKEPFTDPEITKTAHNAKYDYAILERYGIAVEPLGFDTMIAEWLTNPASKHLGLKELTSYRLGIEMTPISDLIGKGKGQKTFAEVPIDLAAPYGAADADMTLRLANELRP